MILAQDRVWWQSLILKVLNIQVLFAANNRNFLKELLQKYYSPPEIIVPMYTNVHLRYVI